MTTSWGCCSFGEDGLCKAGSTVLEVENLWPRYLIRIFVINIFPERNASNLRCWPPLLICERSSRGIRWLIFHVKNTNNPLIHFSLRIKWNSLSDLSSPDTDSHCVWGAYWVKCADGLSSVGVVCFTVVATHFIEDTMFEKEETSSSWVVAGAFQNFFSNKTNYSD